MGGTRRRRRAAVNFLFSFSLALALATLRSRSFFNKLTKFHADVLDMRLLGEGDEASIREHARFRYLAALDGVTGSML